MWHITNLLLTEREGLTGEYWPEVVAVRTERSEVHTKTTEGQYSPVRLELARLVSSLLYDTRAMLVLNLPTFENKNTQRMTVSTETVRMAKSRPRKNQSERSDLPCHIITWYNVSRKQKFYYIYFRLFMHACMRSCIHSLKKVVFIFNVRVGKVNLDLLGNWDLVELQWVLPFKIYKEFASWKEKKKREYYVFPFFIQGITGLTGPAGPAGVAGMRVRQFIHGGLLIS